MTKNYVKLLEIGERDAFFSGIFEMEDGTSGTLVSRLLGRVFEVIDTHEGSDGWSVLDGVLVGDSLGIWDDGHYIFWKVKLEKVSK